MPPARQSNRSVTACHGRPVSPDAYRKRIAALELTQEAAGELLGVTGRTGQKWATEGPPKAVAMLLLAVGNDRKKLNRLAQHCNNS